MEIQSDKLSKKLSETLEKGVIPSLCIKTLTGCRVGLYAGKYYGTKDLSKGDWPKLLGDPNVYLIELLSYGKYCEYDENLKANPVIHCVALNVDDALRVAARGACGDTPCDPTKVTGGFPPAKDATTQFFEGLKELLLTNPAILACLATKGIACPLVAWTKLPSTILQQLVDAWYSAGYTALKSKLEEIARAHGINFTGLLPYAGINPPGGGNQPNLPDILTGGPTPTGERVSLNIAIGPVTINNVKAEKMSDGSLRVAELSVSALGSVSFLWYPSSCKLSITKGAISGDYFGQGISGGCQYTIFGYTVTIKYAGSGLGGLDDIFNTLSQDKVLLIGGLAFLAIVGLILLTRR